MIGLPNGTSSSLYPALEKARDNTRPNLKLKGGNGNDGDDYG